MPSSFRRYPLRPESAVSLRQLLTVSKPGLLSLTSHVLPTSFPCGPLGSEGNKFAGNGDRRGCSTLFRVEGGKVGIEYEMRDSIPRSAEGKLKVTGIVIQILL